SLALGVNSGSLRCTTRKTSCIASLMSDVATPRRLSDRHTKAALSSYTCRNCISPSMVRGARSLALTTMDESTREKPCPNSYDDVDPGEAGNFVRGVNAAEVVDGERLLVERPEEAGRELQAKPRG